MAPSVATKDQTFSFEVVSCLLAILANSKVTLGDAHFALMEKYEGSTTKSGYQHRFRAVKARAKEINEEVMKAQSESDTTPVKPKAKARVQSKTPSTAGSKRSELCVSRRSCYWRVLMAT